MWLSSSRQLLNTYAVFAFLNIHVNRNIRGDREFSWQISLQIFTDQKFLPYAVSTFLHFAIFFQAITQIRCDSKLVHAFRNSRFFNHIVHLSLINPPYGSVGFRPLAVSKYIFLYLFFNFIHSQVLFQCCLAIFHII